MNFEELSSGIQPNQVFLCQAEINGVTFDIIGTVSTIY